MAASATVPVKFLRGNARAAVNTLLFRLQRFRAYLEPNWQAQLGTPITTPNIDAQIDQLIGSLEIAREQMAFERYHGKS